MRNKLILNSNLSIAVFVLCVTQILSLFGIGALWLQLSQKAESLAVINYGDSFIAKRANEFDLPQVIMQYDQVIDAIDKFYLDKGYYPSDLKALTPNYLSKAPGVYIRNGEKLTFLPEPMSSDAKATPFTFNIYGHYPGLASMHGWFLSYCPIKYSNCDTSEADRFRINDRWIWIHNSAL